MPNNEWADAIGGLGESDWAAAIGDGTDAEEPEREPVGRFAATGRGFVQGATFGFADELKAAAAAIGIDPVDYAAALMTGGATIIPTLAGKAAKAFYDKGTGGVADDYRANRDVDRVLNQQASDDRPGWYLGGEISGAAATAMLPGGVSATAARALGAGALAGAASGLGGSEADITQGDYVGAMKDTLLGGTVGAAGGVALYGAGKGVSSVVNRFRGAKSAAKTAARETAGKAGELEAATALEPRKTFYQKSMELQDEASEMLGEKFRFRPGQSTGDPELALAELKASNFPQTMSRAQSEERKQLEQGARLLDMYVDRVASNPAGLGKSDVGNRLVEVVENHVGNLAKARSAAASPLYDAASAAAQGRRVIPTSATGTAMDDILAKNKFAPNKVTSQVRSTLDKVRDASSKTGRITIDDAQNMRSLWSSVANGDLDIFEGLSQSNQKRLARQVLEAIDADLDTAAKSISGGKAVDLLRQANAMWSKHSAEINEASTDTVKRILKVSDDAGDTVTGKLMAASPDQIAGVFRVLNRASPDDAMQLRAQLLDDVFSKAGKPLRAVGGQESIAAKEGVAKLSPKRAINALVDNEQRLLAAFAGDDKAVFALRRSLQLLKRLSFGPGIKGSTTAPQLAQAAQEAGSDIAETGLRALGLGPVSGVVSRAARFVYGALGDDKALNKIYSDPASIDIFNEALQAQLSGRAPKTPTLNAIVALADVLGLQVVGN